MIGSVTAVVLNILLNYIFINQCGYIAAGYTTLFCYLVQAVIDFLAMNKVVEENIYNMRFIVLLSGVIICIALFSGILCRHQYVRYAVILCMMVVTILKRKRLIRIFKELRRK